MLVCDARYAYVRVRKRKFVCVLECVCVCGIYMSTFLKVDYIWIHMDMDKDILMHDCVCI